LGMFSYYSQWVSGYSDKIEPLTGGVSFPLGLAAVKAFELVKGCIAESCLVCPNDTEVLVLESDASDYALSASLNQGGKPIAFFSRTLNAHEKHHPSVEKEACAIVEACRKWRHYLVSRKFILITDQQSVSFMFSSEGKHGKIKNDKILRWRIELSNLNFDIKYRPGKDNVTADCLSRAQCSALSQTGDLNLKELHISLCHPGISRMSHYVRDRNLPYSVEDIKRMTSQCKTCAELKPNFYKPDNPPLIKATSPLERISIDFKGPLPSGSQNKYILTMVDEYSRFPFAFPCRNIDSATVKSCLTQIFMLFGNTGYVHSDRGPALISTDLKSFLLAHGIGSSHSAAYNPRGNGQCERYNGIIWKTVQLALASKNLKISQWEVVLPEALHAIRCLLCTATNQTPHERFFGFPRRTSTHNVLPQWLIEEGKVLLRRHVKSSKYEPSCDEVDLIETNPSHARVKLANGVTKTVSLRDLAPIPRQKSAVRDEMSAKPLTPLLPGTIVTPSVGLSTESLDFHPPSPESTVPQPLVAASEESAVNQRPQRNRSKVERLEYDKLGG
jgi:hypothetical protein